MKNVKMKQAEYVGWLKLFMDSNRQNTSRIMNLMVNSRSTNIDAYITLCFI